MVAVLMVLRRLRVGRRGGGGWIGDSLTGRAHSERGGRGHLHVKLGRQLQGSQLLDFFLKPSVLFRQALTALLEELAVHLRLLQLGPATTPSILFGLILKCHSHIFNIKTNEDLCMLNTLLFCFGTRLPPALAAG